MSDQADRLPALGEILRELQDIDTELAAGPVTRGMLRRFRLLSAKLNLLVRNQRRGLP